MFSDEPARFVGIQHIDSFSSLSTTAAAATTATTTTIPAVEWRRGLWRETRAAQSFYDTGKILQIKHDYKSSQKRFSSSLSERLRRRREKKQRKLQVSEALTLLTSLCQVPVVSAPKTLAPHSPPSPRTLQKTQFLQSPNKPPLLKTKNVSGLVTHSNPPSEGPSPVHSLDSYEPLPQSTSSLEVGAAKQSIRRPERIPTRSP